MTNLTLSELTMLIKLYDRGLDGLRGCEPSEDEPLYNLIKHEFVKIANVRIPAPYTETITKIFTITPFGKAFIELLTQVNIEKFKEAVCSVKCDLDCANLFS